MKKIFLLLSLSISVALIFFSCKKANDERNDANKPPVAIAGPDLVVTLPIDSISLDGSASNDPVFIPVTFAKWAVRRDKRSDRIF